MSRIIQHSIEYMCPGTFMAESSTHKVKANQLTIVHAVKLAEGIKVRYGAKPYGFYLVTTTYTETVVDGEVLTGKKTVKQSGCHHLNGEVFTLDTLPKIEDNKILRSNMECNDWPAVVETTNSYRHMAILEKEGIVLQGTKIVDRGKNYY